MAITSYSQETKQTLKVSNLNKVKGVERCVQEYPQKKYAIAFFLMKMITINRIKTYLEY